MTISKEAIELAIRGGWEPEIKDFAEYALVTFDPAGIKWQSITLDPSFWKALGKELGWSPFVAYINGQWINESEDRKYMSDTAFRLPNWQWKAHGFFTLILTEQPTEDYWNTLLN